MNNLCFRTFNDLWAEITLPQSIGKNVEVMKLGAFLLAAGFASLAAAAGAEPTSLAGDELRRAVRQDCLSQRIGLRATHPLCGKRPYEW